jgi:hypothetical protein
MPSVVWIRRRRGDLFRIRLVRPDRSLTKRDRRVFALERERLKQRRAYRAQHTKRKSMQAKLLPFAGALSRSSNSQCKTTSL